MIEYKVKVFSNRTEWFLNGKLHREDGPAIEYADGDKFWYKNGKYHREDGPACEFDGTKEWFLNGKYHREDGPAIEYASGTKCWCKNGKCHREDGPAYEWANGDKDWYLEGNKLTEKEFLQRKKPCVGKKITIDGVDYELA